MKAKRVLSALAALSITLTAMAANAPIPTGLLNSTSLTAYAADAPTSGYCGDPSVNNGQNITWSLDEDGKLTISGTGKMKNYYADAPWPCGKVKSVEITEGVTHIGEFAFYGCKNLTSVSIPNSVKYIRKAAFGYCEGLRSVTIPKGMVGLEQGAFDYCHNLESVTLPDGLSYIDMYTFYDCTKLTSINFPSTLNSIGMESFSKCTSLKSVSIPSSVSVFGKEAFLDCKQLSTVIIDREGPAELRENVFNGTADNLLIYVPNGSVNEYKTNWNVYADKIRSSSIASGTCGKDSDVAWAYNANGSLIISGTGAMADYDDSANIPWADFRSQITNIIIGNDVTSIGNLAFSNCTQVTAVTIPENVTSIGDAAFSGCTALAAVNAVSVTPPALGENVFDQPSDQLIIYVPETAIYGANGYKANWSAYAEQIQRSVIASDYCGPYFVNYYKEIRNSINAKWSLTSDGTLTISGHGKMADFFAPVKVPWADYLSQIKRVVIEDGITHIGDFSFYDCKALTSISIPDSVTSIGKQTFCSCILLPSITIPENVTDIGSSAFSSCKALTSVSIPKGVTTIPQFAFNNCTSLVSVTIPEGVTSIEKLAFGYTKLSSVILPDGFSNIGDSAFYECKAMKSVTIPTSVKTIGEDAFFECSALTSVTIPNGVKSIGAYTFMRCYGLRSVTLPASLETIGEYAFCNCYNLNEMVVNSVQPPIITGTEGKYTLMQSNDGGGHYSPLPLEHIYVPDISIANYMLANYWNDYSSKICKLSDYKFPLNAGNTSIANLTYNGTEQTPVIKFGDKTLVKDTDYTVDTESNTSATDAGTYKIKISGKGNYANTTTELTWKIVPADVNVTAEAVSKTYGEDDPALTYTADDLFGTDTYTGSLVRAEGETADTYAITQGSLTAGDNYNIIFTGADFTIKKADINPTVTIEGWTYGETANTPSVSDNTDNGEVSCQYKAQDENDFAYSDTVPTNAGEYTVRAIIKETANYNGKTVTADFTISKAAPTYTEPVLQGTRLTHYSSDLALIKTAGTVTEEQGTMYYAVTNTEEAPAAEDEIWTNDETAIKASKGGTYYVWYKIEGAGNYVLAPTMLDSVKVTQYSAPSYYSQSWNLSMADFKYDGTFHMPKFIGNAYGEITYTFYNADTNEELSEAPTKPGNYRVKVFAEGGSRYYSRTQEISFSILNPFDKNNKNKMTEVSAFKKNNVIPTVEGKVFAGWFTDSSCTTPYTGDSGEAYAKFIDNRSLTVKAQITSGTTKSSTNASIRFITSLDSLKYQNIGFKITFNGKTIDQKLTKVYSSLLANGKKVNPGVFSEESHYMGAFTLNNIPKSVFDKEFTVTPYYTTEDGTVVEGETSTYVIADMIK